MLGRACLCGHAASLVGPCCIVSPDAVPTTKNIQTQRNGFGTFVQKFQTASGKSKCVRARATRLLLRLLHARGLPQGRPHHPGGACIGCGFACVFRPWATTQSHATDCRRSFC
jgi:hypothetical protein